MSEKKKSELSGKDDLSGMGGNAGEKKKTRNRRSKKTVKEFFDIAFHESGSVQGLVNWIKDNNDNRTEFYKMYSRQLPKPKEEIDNPDAKKKYNLEPEEEKELIALKNKMLKLRLIKPREKDPKAAGT